MKNIFTLIFGAKKTGYDSDFSVFMRTAKARERKKVFLKAARLATQDQQKMLRTSTK